MSDFFSTFDAAWGQPLGWTIVHSLWQLALVATLFAVASRAMRQNSAGARYVLGCLTLTVMACLPLATMLVVWNDQATPDERWVAMNEPHAADATARRSGAEAALPGRRAADAARSDGSEAQARFAAAWRGWADRVAPLLPWIAQTWMVGVLIFSARPLVGLAIVRRLRRRGLSPLPAGLAQQAGELAARLGVKRVVQFAESSLVEIPSVIGYLRPLVLLPASALTGLSASELELILAHELAHVRRHDYLVNLVQTGLETALFYHPAMWWVSAQVRKERENCCDDAAVAICGNRGLYVRALLAMEEQRTTTGLALAAGGGSLAERARRLVSPRTSQAGLQRASAWLAGPLLAGAMVALVIFSPSLAVDEKAGTPDKPDAAVAQAADPPAEKGEAKPITISGVCVDKDGQAVADARVRLFSIEYSQTPSSAKQLQDIRSDKQGHFRFEPVNTGELRQKQAGLTVIAQATGKATAYDQVYEPVADVSKTLTVLPAGSLRGRVTDAEGRPVQGAVVATDIAMLAPGTDAGTAVTDADGRYEIGDLPVWDMLGQLVQLGGGGMGGMHRGIVLHRDFARQVFAYTKVPDTVDVTLGKPAEVTGKIVLAESGKPAVGVLVMISNELIFSEPWTQTKTDDQGNYRLADLPPGRYLLATQLAGRTNMATTVELHAGRNSQDLKVAGGGILRGRVIDATTGRPVAIVDGERLQVIEATGRMDGLHSVAGTNVAWVAADGSFELRLPAGKNELTMFLGEHWLPADDDEFPVTVEMAEGKTAAVDIRLRPRAAEE